MDEREVVEQKYNMIMLHYKYFCILYPHGVYLLIFIYFSFGDKVLLFIK